MQATFNNFLSLFMVIIHFSHKQFLLAYFIGLL